MASSNPDFIYPGQELTIPAAGEYVPENAAARADQRRRSIVVSTEDQRIYAYQDGQMMRTHLVSTGLPDTPTVKGDYAIYVKYLADRHERTGLLSAASPVHDVLLLGLWHSRDVLAQRLRAPMSHGCVNLPTDEAQWFFNFATSARPCA